MLVGRGAPRQLAASDEGGYPGRRLGRRCVWASWRDGAFRSSAKARSSASSGQGVDPLFRAATRLGEAVGQVRRNPDLAQSLASRALVDGGLDGSRAARSRSRTTGPVTRCPGLVLRLQLGVPPRPACSRTVVAGALLSRPAGRERARSRPSSDGTQPRLHHGHERQLDGRRQARWSRTSSTQTANGSTRSGRFEKTGDGHFVGHREDLTRDADVVEDAEGIRMSYKANTRCRPGAPSISRSTTG